MTNVLWWWAPKRTTVYRMRRSKPLKSIAALSTVLWIPLKPVEVVVHDVWWRRCFCPRRKFRHPEPVSASHCLTRMPAVGGNCKISQLSGRVFQIEFGMYRDLCLFSKIDSRYGLLSHATRIDRRHAELVSASHCFIRLGYRSQELHKFSEILFGHFERMWEIWELKWFLNWCCASHFEMTFGHPETLCVKIF